MKKIELIDVGYYVVPLESILVDALHGEHKNFELVTATVKLSDGSIGTGYTYTGGFGGAAIAKMIESDLKPLLIGKEVLPPEQMMKYMNTRIHYVARGGIASFAISALDIAFWDADLKGRSIPLCEALGSKSQKVKTYYGGIDLAFTEKELLDSLQKQIENGHTSVKIKLGKADEKEDIARVKAVRKLVGDDAIFMVDANMIWSVPQAIRMAKALEEYNIFWLEEPTNPDDYEGYAKIGQTTTIPIAMGENLHTIYEHELAVKVGRISYPIPDCSNICGISGFLQVAKLAKEYSLPVSSHGMQELHVNVLAGLENRGYLEFHSFPIYKYTIDPIQVKDGYVEPSKDPGVGVNFDWDILGQYKQ